MDQQQGVGSQSQAGGGSASVNTLDSNFGLDVGEKPWSDFLPAHGITAEAAADLVHISQSVARHEPDIAYIPVADFHRLTGKGDNHYRGLAMATSKFTGLVRQRRLPVVRRDDPAGSIADLRGPSSPTSTSPAHRAASRPPSPCSGRAKRSASSWT